MEVHDITTEYYDRAEYSAASPDIRIRSLIPNILPNILALKSYLHAFSSLFVHHAAHRFLDMH